LYPEICRATSDFKSIKRVQRDTKVNYARRVWETFDHYISTNSDLPLDMFEKFLWSLCTSLGEDFKICLVYYLFNLSNSLEFHKSKAEREEMTESPDNIKYTDLTPLAFQSEIKIINLYKNVHSVIDSVIANIGENDDLFALISNLAPRYVTEIYTLILLSLPEASLRDLVSAANSEEVKLKAVEQFADLRKNFFGNKSAFSLASKQVDNIRLNAGFAFYHSR
jgi:hypothetical protein